MHSGFDEVNRYPSIDDGYLLHGCSLEKIDLGVYFTIKLFLDKFLGAKVEGEKSLNFAILEISCCNS